MNSEPKSRDMAKDLVFPWMKNLIKSAAISGITLKTGPNGGLLALLLSPTLSTVLDAIYKEFETRFLSPREKYRIDWVSVRALKEIESRIDGGATLRDDGFFTNTSEGRTKAEEIFESVLLKAKDQYQESKLGHFGEFFGRVGFASTSPALANHLLNTAETLSYRQFQLLAHVSNVSVFDGEPLRGRKHALAELQAFRDEEMMLLDKAEFGGVSFLSTLGRYQSQLSEMGREFVDLFAINQIPAHELLEIRRLINRCAEGVVIS